MAVAKNDITGDSIQTRGTSDAYLNNYDLIFRKKKLETSDTDNVKENVDGKTETRSSNN